MCRLQFHINFGAAFVLAFVLCNWLVTAESSPLHDYFLWNVELRNFYALLHTGPALVGMMVSGNVHQASPTAFMVAGALQWFLIGFVLSFLFYGFKAKPSRP